MGTSQLRGVLLLLCLLAPHAQGQAHGPRIEVSQVRGSRMILRAGAHLVVADAAQVRELVRRDEGDLDRVGIGREPKRRVAAAKESAAGRATPCGLHGHENPAPVFAVVDFLVSRTEQNGLEVGGEVLRLVVDSHDDTSRFRLRSVSVIESVSSWMRRPFTSGRLLSSRAARPIAASQLLASTVTDWYARWATSAGMRAITVNSFITTSISIIARLSRGLR